MFKINNKNTRMTSLAYFISIIIIFHEYQITKNVNEIFCQIANWVLHSCLGVPWLDCEQKKANNFTSTPDC